MSAMGLTSERYEIQRPIGCGGHAEVHLGVARGADGFERPVAIKRVRADLANQGQLVAMLIEEAHHAARLAHPNVVAVLDLARDGAGRPYLVMEHVDGVNLAALLEMGPVPFPAVIFIVRELLSGLGYLHAPRDPSRRGEPGLVHRDVTPRNVLLSWAGAVKLADFGLAQMLQQTVGGSAREGTPGYLSPEQTRGEPLDGRSDLYAAGIVLWELLAARRLRPGWPGEAPPPVPFSAIPRPSAYRQVPADLEAVTMRLLAFDRDERYPAAELAAHDLMRCHDAPRDGRGELVDLLDHRFPHPRHQGPLSRPPGPRTTPDPGAPMDSLAAPYPATPKPEKHRAGTAQRSRQQRQRRQRALGWIAVALVIAMVLAILALR
jgi:serine/threonine-protein kinase